MCGSFTVSHHLLETVTDSTIVSTAVIIFLGGRTTDVKTSQFTVVVTLLRHVI